MNCRNLFLNVSSFIIGVVGTLLYTNLNPDIALYKTQKDPVLSFKLIKDLLSNDQRLNDATAVYATRTATQFGKEFHNIISKEGRKSIIAHPYDKQGSGVSATVVYTDATTGDINIILMEKLKTRNKPEDGFTNRFEQIGGYTKGAGVEGSSKTSLSFASEELRDATEDNYLNGHDIKRIDSSSDKNEEYITKSDLEQLEKTIIKYALHTIKKEPYVQNFDPNDIKNI